MKLKLTEYTDAKGEKHLIVYFAVIRTEEKVRTLEIFEDGSVGIGPKIPWDELPGHKDSKCRKIELEFSVPT